MATNWVKHADDIDGDFWTADLKIGGKIVLSAMVSMERGKWGFQVTAMSEHTVLEDNNCKSRADAMIKAAISTVACLQVALASAEELVASTPKEVT